MHDILVISDDVVGKKMAGPGIRAWEISKSLSKEFKVMLAVPDYSLHDEDEAFTQDIDFDIGYYKSGGSRKIKKIGENSKIILTQGYVLSKFPVLLKLPAHLIMDMYIPFPIENMFVYQWKIPRLRDRELMHLNDLSVFNQQLIHGDHFISASPRQRDLLVGALTSLNRINPKMLQHNASLDDLISIVPFGISEPEDGEKRKSGLRAQYPQIHKEDVIFIWGGVISNWFDPITLIKAFSQAVKENQKLKLFFLSTKHANPLLPEFDMAKQAMRLSEELNLTDKYIFFNQDWIDYNQLPQYFGDADVGVSIHKTHFETYFSFRTRILDYLKYGLPIICTEGDYFADLVRQRGLGTVVGSENQEELKKAILEIGTNPKLRIEIKNKMEGVKSHYYWAETTKPLLRYCKKVLDGKIGKKDIPSPEELKNIFSRKSDSRLRHFNNKYTRRLIQKLPLSLQAKLKRLVKFKR